MFVTHSFQIPYDRNLYDELRIMQREAASVWNDIVRETTSYYFACKNWLSKTEIQAIRKQTYNLHSQTVQAIADKYVANRETIRQLRKTDKKAKYPWRRKYYYCIPLKKASMDVSKETITIKKAESGKRKSIASQDGVVGTDLALLKDCSSLKSCSLKVQPLHLPMEGCKWNVCEKEPHRLQPWEWSGIKKKAES